MIIARNVDELRAACSGSISFVPTMGALHAGHASLIELAAVDGGCVVVSDFVNPTQFGTGEDFDLYPRDLDADAVIAAAAGASVLFVPTLETVYPTGFATTVEPGALASQLCGATRPGHFAGVATIVTRLFGIVRPVRAIFGRKDYQQLIVVSSVTRDLALAVEIIGAPTVRDPDGLALSSRNRYLTADERSTALAIPHALDTIAAAYVAGERDAGALVLPALEQLSAIQLDYLELRNAHDLGPYEPSQPAIALVAGHVGKTRLIDNIELAPDAERVSTKEFA